jgi:hypothetical protein
MPPGAVFNGMKIGVSLFVSVGDLSFVIDALDCPLDIHRKEGTKRDPPPRAC